MAVKDVLTHLDGAKVSELQNFLIHKLASAPASPTEGQIYYNTATHRAEVWNGTEWVPFDTSQLVAGNALTRTGNTFDVAAGTGLEISSDTIRIAAAAAGNGLSGGGGSALAVNVAASPGGIEIVSDALRIAATAAGNGLTGGGGSALAVGAGTGILSEADAVAVDTSLIATRAYVESVAQGLDPKASVRLATGNVSLPTNTLVGNVLEASANAALTVDGKSVAVNDRILVKDEGVEAKKHGIYVVVKAGSGTEKWKLERAADANATGEITGGTYTFVEEGTLNSDTGWVVTSNGTPVLNTDAITWTQFTGAGQVIDGEGIGKTGNELFVEAGEGLLQTSNGLKVNPAVVALLTAANVFTGLMTIKRAGDLLIFQNASGEEQGKVTQEERTINLGGSSVKTSCIVLKGQAALDGVQLAIEGGVIDANNSQIHAVAEPTNNSDAATKAYVDSHGKFAANVGDGTSTAIAVEHKLATRDITVEVYRNAEPWDTVDVTVERTSTEKITLRFNTAPSASQYRVVIKA